MAMQERVRRTPSAPKATWLDRAISYVSPTAGYRRMAARAAIAARESFARIEAADHGDSRAHKWLISRLSPDSQAEQDLQTVRDRSRDLYQNDAIGGAVDSKVNHIIGTGHTPQARVRESETITAERADRINGQLEALYSRWSVSADVSGRRSLWQLSRLAGRHNEFDGESFTIMADVGTADKPIPLALQVIDPERVETPPEHSGNPLVRLGVRYDRKGRIVSYFIRKTHPGDTKQVNLEYDEVPADRVLHVFEPWFAGQSRGLPWMVRAIQRTKDAKDYDDSTILKAQVEACFAAFVESPYSAFDAAEGASTGTTAGGKPMQDMIPGTIQYLNPGEKISFGSPAAPGGGFMGFMEWCYGRIAAAVSWPYEMVTRRWSGLSFAAGRLVLSEAKMVTGIGQRLMREAWFSRVWNRMVEEAVIVGEVDVSAAEFLRSPWIYTEHDWIPPKWDYAINPGEEVRADVDEIESGLATYEEKLGKRGHDLETFIAMRARERRLLADAGLPVSPEQVSRYQRPQTQQAPADQQQTEEVLA